MIQHSCCNSWYRHIVANEEHGSSLFNKRAVETPVYYTGNIMNLLHRDAPAVVKCNVKS